MSVLDSIQQARERGASSQQILDEIQKQNPTKASVINEAFSRGASSDQILQEITLQNQGTARPQVSGNFEDVAPTAFKQGLIGVGKGVVDTAMGMGQLGEKMLRAVTPDIVERKVGIKDRPTGAEGLKQNLATATGMTQEQLFKPQNTAQKFGFYGEKTAEFLIPSGYVTKATGALKGTTAASKLASGGRAAKVAGTALTHGLPEFVSAAGVSLAQTGGDVKEAIKEGGVAAAIPVVGKGLSVLMPKASTVKAVATGVPSEVFDRIKKMPLAYDAALEHVTKNSNQPFFDLATQVARKLKGQMGKASDDYVRAVTNLSMDTADEVYDVSKNIDEITDGLKKSFNIGVDVTEDGVLAVTKTPQTPFSDREIANIDDLLTSVAQSNEIGLRDVIDLNQKFDSAYNQIPFSPDGKPTKYHALVESMKKNMDTIIEEKIPELKPINQQYAAVRKVYSEFANKFLDADGGLRPGGEQFLSNVDNLNKGAQRKNLLKLEEVTGLNILDNVTILKDAQKLQHLFPQTGSRTLDILRSLAVRGMASGGTGAAVMTGNIPAAAATIAGTAATSPRVVGKTSIEAAKLIKKFPDLPEEVVSILNRVSGN